MIRFDLRQDEDTFDRLAPFKVLSVMCQPSDRVQRERMLAVVQRETEEGHPRRSALSNDEFSALVRLTAARGAVAGGLLLIQLQLHDAGRSSSLNSALPLVSALLPAWRQEMAPCWSKEDYIDHRPRSRRKMLEAYNQFGSVAHLWAALIHGIQHQRDDIWPGSVEALPTFLAYAESIQDMACHLASRRPGPRCLINPSEIWTFIIPAGLRRTAPLDALPLNPEQLKVLTSTAKRSD